MRRPAGVSAVREDAFCALHPALPFGFYLVVLTVTVLVLHPAVLAISLLSAAGYLAALGGARALWRQVRWALPVLLLAALVNPVFNHRGVTALFVLPNGNAVTWEAVAYGLAAGTMLAAAALWFASFHRVLTSDKLMALFGRAAPAFSLLFSMALRFVPRFARQFRQTARAQRALGAEPKGKLRAAVQVFSATVTWALENAIVTADSMKSRGYGLPGRTAFSRARFTARDRRLACILGGLLALTGAGLLAGAGRADYFPAVALAPGRAWSVGTYLAFALFCNFPLLLHWKEAVTWRRLRSKI